MFWDIYRKGLNENRDSLKTPRRDYTSGDTNRSPQLVSGKDDIQRDRVIM